MVKFAVSQQLGKRICELVGVNPADCLAVRFDFSAGNIATIQLDMAAHMEDVTSLVDEMSKFRWVERKTTKTYEGIMEDSDV